MMLEEELSKPKTQRSARQLSTTAVRIDRLYTYQTPQYGLEYISFSHGLLKLFGQMSAETVHCRLCLKVRICVFQLIMKTYSVWASLNLIALLLS